MVYIAYFILFFAFIQMLVAFVNLIFNQKFENSKSQFNELVSVLIPARNEESNIKNILNDLINQDYQNIEILVFNDQSSDKTAEIVIEYSKIDGRVKLINSDGLPSGWLGKNYACHILSAKANGEYFLFLDADVRISNDIIIKTIHHSEKHNLGLLSIFPKQIMLNIGEKITVPVMNFILLSLLPLILVRKSDFQSLAAANGQFMLFKSAIYNRTLPHEKMKANKVEDIEIARYLKKSKIKIACLTGNENISCRMYNGFSDAVGGFSKNIINFFGNSVILAIFFWLVTTFGFLIVMISSPELILVYLYAILMTRILVSIISKQNIFENIIYLIPQQMAMGIFILRSISNKFKKQLEWKGRNISS